MPKSDVSIDDRCYLAAQRLMQAHSSLETFVPLANEEVSTLRKAYLVQKEFVRIMAIAADAQPIGYKIGLTSRAMQSMCNISSPVAGVVLSNRLLHSPATVSKPDYGRLGLEFEIAVQLARDINKRKERLCARSIADSVGAVCAAIELVDDRAADYTSLDAISLVADNAWNAGVVLGKFVRVTEDLAKCEGVVFANGEQVGRGLGSDVLGHPYESLAWLSNHLIAQGSFLRAGDIVMTGSMIKTQFPVAPTRYDFDLGGLGSVSCEVLI